MPAMRRSARPLPRALSIALVVASVGSASTVSADTSQERVRTKEGLNTGGQLNVLAEGVAMPHERPHLGPGVIPAERYFAWKVRRLEEQQLQWYLGLTPQVQVGTLDGAWHVNSEADFIGEWEPFKLQRTRGQLEWWLRWNQTYTTLTTAEFARRENLVVQTNDGDTGDRKYSLSIATLWWEQTFFDVFGFRLGQLNAQTMYGVNEYLSNDRTSFMALPLAGPYGTGFMEAPIGLGIQAGVWNDWAYATGGVQEATANQEYPDFQSLAAGELAYFAEVGVTPRYDTPDEGAYRVTYSFIGRTGDGASDQPGHSLVVSAKQRIRGRWGLFGRYTQSFKRLPEDGFRLAVVGGLVFVQPLGFDSDRVGIAYIFSAPSDGALRNEHGIEAFWRLQLTQLLSVTPDLQLYFTPARGTNRKPVAVFGLRMQVAI